MASQKNSPETLETNEVFPDSLWDEDTKELKAILKVLNSIDQYKKLKPALLSPPAGYVVVRSLVSTDVEFHIQPKQVALSTPELAHQEGYSLTIYKANIVYGSTFGDSAIAQIDMVELKELLAAAESITMQHFMLNVIK